MTSTDYARQIADALLLAELDPGRLCRPEAASFGLNVSRLVVCYREALEREHPGIGAHMTRLGPKLTAALTAWSEGEAVS